MATKKITFTAEEANEKVFEAKMAAIPNVDVIFNRIQQACYNTKQFVNIYFKTLPDDITGKYTKEQYYEKIKEILESLGYTFSVKTVNLNGVDDDCITIKWK